MNSLNILSCLKCFISTKHPIIDRSLMTIIWSWQQRSDKEWMLLSVEGKHKWSTMGWKVEDYALLKWKGDSFCWRPAIWSCTQSGRMMSIYSWTVFFYFIFFNECMESTTYYSCKLCLGRRNSKGSKKKHNGVIINLQLLY